MRGQRGTMEYLDYTSEMHPIGAQILGSKKELAASSARILEDAGFDLIDFNCGCPVNKVVKDGSGSAMLKRPEDIGEIISLMVGAVDIPVTVKVRAGWDANSIIVDKLVKIAEEAGALSIAIHGRTRAQGYAGKANWEWIKLAKQAANKIMVVGNGDIFSGGDAKLMFEQTGCDAALIGRGMLGNPWLVKEIIAHITGEEEHEYSLGERCRELIEHYSYIREYKNEQQAVIEMRRIACWYFKNCRGSREFRRDISRAQSHQEVQDLINNFAAGKFFDDSIEQN